MSFIVKAREQASGQQCEADCYIGITRRFAGDTAAAKEFLEEYLATNMGNFPELTFTRTKLVWLTEQK